MRATRILVVEDEIAVAQGIEDGLRRRGYEVAGRAVSAGEAVAKAVAVRPELVLMDIHLRGEVSGIVAAREIRDRLGIPVVFLTAFGSEDVVEEAKAADPYGYVVKPFGDRELGLAIEIALCRRKAEEEIRRLNQLYDALIEANRGFVQAESRADVLRGLCRVMAVRGLADVVWVGVLDRGGGGIESVYREGVGLEAVEEGEGSGGGGGGGGRAGSGGGRERVNGGDPGWAVVDVRSARAVAGS
jgi:AmiR/NasT family two-component response regulator